MKIALIELTIFAAAIIVLFCTGITVARFVIGGA